MESIGNGNELANVGTGIVYILSNPAMPDYVKIGFTADLPERMRSLDQSTSVPLPFECVSAAKVENPRRWEQTIHEVFSESRVNRRREFFAADVAAKAALILQTAKLEDVTHTAPAVASVDEPRREGGKKRENFNFGMLGITEGELLEFYSDDEVVCMVTQAKPPRVEFAGEEMTVTEATARALGG